MKRNPHKDVWVGVDQITESPAYKALTEQEFDNSASSNQLTDEASLSLEANRRDFLKYLGFGLGAATLASSCEIPLKRAIPYVVKPDEIVPGVATYYATSFVQGGDYCSILVKTREGRPIKIEGNSLSKVTMGGTSARAQASVLSLYDTSRISGPAKITNGKIDMPAKKGEGMGWGGADKELRGRLKTDIQIRIVTHTNMSPTSNKALDEFKAKYPNAKVITYDPVSAAALLDANLETFGIRAIPSYRFDRANVIVSFDADFLGTWISPVEYAAQYIKNRKIDDISKPKLSRHIQVESHMSLTGSNADNRILVKPSEQGLAILALYNEIAKVTGGSTLSGTGSLEESKAEKIRKVAKELLDNQRSALVVSGSNNIGEQILVNAINYMLGSYGTTIDFSQASNQRKGDDKAIQDLITEMNAGKVDALFVLDYANPAFDIPNASKFVDGMSKVALKISFSSAPNETTLLCDYALPTNHYLESWGDVEPKAGQYSLVQPTIAPLFDTRQWEETLLLWADSPDINVNSDQPYFDYLKLQWERNLFPLDQNNFSTFQAFWDSTLHDGVFSVVPPAVPVELGGDLVAAARKIRAVSNASMEISFPESVAIGGGQYANNPWLLEMPDPVTRCVWGNYLAVPISWDGGFSFEALNGFNPKEASGEADITEITIDDIKEKCTVIRQFGQMAGTVSLSLGFGRKHTGLLGKAVGDQVGVDVYKYLKVDEYGYTQYYTTVQNISKSVGKEDFLACVQYHHTMGVTGANKSGQTINVDEKTAPKLRDPFNPDGFQGGIVNRSIIYKGNLSELSELAHHIEERRTEAEELNSQTIYPYDTYTENFYSQGHHWGMHIDLNACIGCGACQVACVAENNVPVVGKTEVSRHHEMTWLRIDRYYYGDYENPNVVYQPMMCQHCDNAPCENVCPVAATNHSSEGLNQMTYNRCIGTRYCANNCPYKVRRFNWLDYTTADIFPANSYSKNDEEVPFGADNLTRMVLNPDVTVRSRGVIEKCSFCVQRIQEGKLTAKKEGRALRDSDVKSACQTACPTGAIVFGDMNNKKGDLARVLNNPLNYQVLEEINTRPSVNYTAKINNRDESFDA